MANSRFVTLFSIINQCLSRHFKSSVLLDHKYNLSVLFFLFISFIDRKSIASKTAVLGFNKDQRIICVNEMQYIS